MLVHEDVEIDPFEISDHAWLRPAVESFVGSEFPMLRFGGGGAQSDAWSQILADALDAVRRDEVAAALVPLENSVEGSVPATMDGLADGDPLVITREVFLDVQ